MLFNNIIYAALAQGLTASAATMMVTVAANNQFQFTPNSVTAQPGDMVAFNFVAQVYLPFLPTPKQLHRSMH
jgi:plastocyanin